ncbi:hypothetical protein CVS40_11926 [Lucilia cuprina]|nr:hypothetical protein CVS40_11926 [Lucilia cuprina]
MHHQFSIRWKNDYLKTLHKRYKWKNSTTNLKIGDLVVVMDDLQPPYEWRLGRIEKTYFDPTEDLPQPGQERTPAKRNTVAMLPIGQANVAAKAAAITAGPLPDVQAKVAADKITETAPVIIKTDWILTYTSVCSV